MVAGGWLALAVIAVIVAPGTARKLGATLAAREGIAAPGTERAHRADHAGRDGLVTERLTCVDELALVDHHCHGMHAATADGAASLESMLTEGDSWPGGSVFDSQAGFMFRWLCPPVLGLPPHAEPGDYVARRASSGRPR